MANGLVLKNRERFSLIVLFGCLDSACWITGIFILSFKVLCVHPKINSEAKLTQEG